MRGSMLGIAWRGTLVALLVACAVALSACAKTNPLLGSWTFQSYAGGGQLGSMLGGLAAQFSQGTVVTFTPQAMIVSHGSERQQTVVDHYEIHGATVTVWIRTASDLMQGQTYRVSADGHQLSRDLGGGIREIFVRAQQM